MPADIRLTSIKSTTLRVDQSILTGKTVHNLSGAFYLCELVLIHVSASLHPHSLHSCTFCIFK